MKTFTVSGQAEIFPQEGGWEDKSDKPESKSAPVLNVRGTSIFGGVEIKN